MIPLRDDQPTSAFPLITVLLIALNAVIFLAQNTLPGFDNSFEMVPYEITHNQDLIGMGQPPITLYYGPSPHPLWLTVFSAMFMHAGLLHIGGNMLFLWIFGNNIEDALGKVRFLFFYLTCGAAAAGLQILTDPNSVIPTLGASGAIAGVLGAYLILYPQARVLSIVPIFGFGFLTEVRAQWVLLVWVVYDILPGFLGSNLDKVGGGVAYFAHLGGFGAGLILILLLGGQGLVAKQRRRANYYGPP